MDSMAADGEAGPEVPCKVPKSRRCRCQEMEGMVAPNPQTADELKALNRKLEWHGAAGRGGPPSLIPGRGAQFRLPQKLWLQGSSLG